VNHLRTILLTFNASFNAVGPDRVNGLWVVKCHLSNFNANPAVTDMSHGISLNSPCAPKVKKLYFTWGHLWSWMTLKASSAVLKTWPKPIPDFSNHRQKDHLTSYRFSYEINVYLLNLNVVSLLVYPPVFWHCRFGDKKGILSAYCSNRGSPFTGSSLTWSSSGKLG